MEILEQEGTHSAYVQIGSYATGCAILPIPKFVFHVITCNNTVLQRYYYHSTFNTTAVNGQCYKRINAVYMWAVWLHLSLLMQSILTYIEDHFFNYRACQTNKHASSFINKVRKFDCALHACSYILSMTLWC